jgi:hypothetical protein
MARAHKPTAPTPDAAASDAVAVAPITVRAIRAGYFKTYRTVGETFEIPPHLFSAVWHEEVSTDDRGHAVSVPLEESMAKRESDRAARPEYATKVTDNPLLKQIANMTADERDMMRSLLIKAELPATA